jgi:hypothetical protein
MININNNTPPTQQPKQHPPPQQLQPTTHSRVLDAVAGGRIDAQVHLLDVEHLGGGLDGRGQFEVARKRELLELLLGDGEADDARHGADHAPDLALERRGVVERHDLSRRAWCVGAVVVVVVVGEFPNLL